MDKMKVVPLGTHNVKDVPASLRKLAKAMEEGKVPNPIHAIVVSVDENGDMFLFHYGTSTTVSQEIGTLFMAAQQLSWKSVE